MREYLEFEKPLKGLDERIEKLTKSNSSKESVQRLIRILTTRRNQHEAELYQNLSPWERTQIARHAQRPSVLTYVNAFCQDFHELHGDRIFGDDQAIVGGFATFAGRSVCVIGHEKGRTLKERMKRNFGMPNPEGYRKALRLMRLAEKFRHPILTFIDTPGAYPGVGAEERGQAEAIAKNLFVMARLQVPIISVITGEGGSGGALALGVADRILMLTHAIYSVISPEGCAAILWNDPAKAPDAATALKMTAEELHARGIIDEVIPEPVGGAHRDPDSTATQLAISLDTHLQQIGKIPIDALIQLRYDKYRSMSAFATASAQSTEDPPETTIS
ncbi:MAG: acetyl-CoA carboxylase carboxyltransferase subunit alpha [Nitrospirales bacterium]|nr:acetyl-CoA carboxylase carboxyltransferase subunit alpha [Nitrospirales bacterium]